jgi:hypothetical protein
MIKFESTNKVPDGYELFLSYENSIPDGSGRLWRYKVSPVKCGGIFYFNSLWEIVKWTREVLETRRLLEGEKSYFEQLVEAFHVGDISEGLFNQEYSRIQNR